MELHFVILALVAIGSVAGLQCFGEVCDTHHEYCKILIHSQTGNCVAQHGHGHHEGIQRCLRHHPDDHCFCHEQACVEDMRRHFTTQHTTTDAPTTAIPTTMPTPPTPAMPPTVTMPATTTLGGPIPACEDKESRCAEATFQQILCQTTNPDTKKYAIATCPKSCNLCAEYYG